VSPQVPVLAHVVATLPNGQAFWPFPEAPRSPFSSGQQEPCTDCAAAGRDGLGVSRDGEGSAPLCLGCWRARQRRAPRRGSLTPEQAGQLAELQEQLACPACKPGAVPLRVDLPTEEAVQARRHQRRRDEERRRRDRARGRRPAPKRTGCPRCGDASWLEAARAVHEQDQAQAAAEAGRVDELHDAVRAARRRAARAVGRLAYLQTWQDRVAEVVAAMPPLVKTGSRGKLRAKRGPRRMARAVWLLADFMARMAAERTARGVVGRGRPPQHALVVGVMAIAADPAAGRRSMAGLSWTALYAGVTTRTVTNAWDYAELVGSATEVERGRTCSLAELDETGLRRRRSVYDLVQLNTSPFDGDPYLGAAAAVVATLLERAVALVDEQQAAVDAAQREVAAAEARLLAAQATVAERTSDWLLLQASVDQRWAGQAKAAYQEALGLRQRATLAVAPRLSVAPDTAAASRAGRADRDGVLATVAAAHEAATRMDSFFHPPRSGTTKRSSSASRGLTLKISGFLTFRPGSTSALADAQRPGGRGEEHKGGASRPAPTRRVAGRTSSQQPRTLDRPSAGSPADSRWSEAMDWAKPLARALARRWDFLGRFLADADDGRRSAKDVNREYWLRVRMIASVLGCRLSRRWTPGEVVRLVERYGLTGKFAAVRTVIGAGDAHSPLKYLARTLDRALTNPALPAVPHYSPVRAAYEAEVLAAELAARAERTAALRAQHSAREAAWNAERSGTGGARAEALAVAAASRGPEPRRLFPTGLAQPAAPAAVAAPAADEHATAWPPPAQPGGGIPYDREHADTAQ
jgi:hypothetical protein